MAELSLHQVERIKKDLIRESISYSHLFHDLLDHICCDIEFEMDRGISFEVAYSNIKNWMGRNRCRKMQVFLQAETEDSRWSGFDSRPAHLIKNGTNKTI